MTSGDWKRGQDCLLPLDQPPSLHFRYPGHRNPNLDRVAKGAGEEMQRSLRSRDSHHPAAWSSHLRLLPGSFCPSFPLALLSAFRDAGAEGGAWGLGWALPGRLTWSPGHRRR